jgi:hypothetical protein
MGEAGYEIQLQRIQDIINRYCYDRARKRFGLGFSFYGCHLHLGSDSGKPMSHLYCSPLLFSWRGLQELLTERRTVQAINNPKSKC